MSDDDLGGKLDTLIRLFAHNAVANFESKKDKIIFLGKAGLGAKEIAEIVDTSPNTVSVTLSVEKKKGAEKPKKEPKSNAKN